MQLDRYLGKPLPDNEYAVGLALGRRIKETPSLGSANLLFMYDGIRGKAIMEGARGMPKVDRKRLEEMLVSVSEFVDKFPIKEMDINPLVVTRAGLKAIDARIVVE